MDSDHVEKLIRVLEANVDELGNHAFDVFRQSVDDVPQWNEARVQAFKEQAKSRLSAVLAVVEHGAAVDEALRRDLQAVGATAARAGKPLSQQLVMLRITRDLLLHGALRFTESPDSGGAAALLEFSQRMLPAVDRLTDAISTGYWQAHVDVVGESSDRFESLVEGIPYGIYEVDIDGIVQFANSALAASVGRPEESLLGLPLNDVFKSSESLDVLLSEHPDDVAQTSLTVDDVDGNRVTFDIDMVVRRSGGSVVGFAGLVRHATTPGNDVDLTPLVRHIHELRRSVEILEDAGLFVQRNASTMSTEQLVGAGESLAKQAQRLLLIIDELDADRRAIHPG